MFHTHTKSKNAHHKSPSSTSKGLTPGYVVGEKRPCFVVFASFCGINNPTVADSSYLTEQKKALYEPLQHISGR